jgi:hypothetical protein
MQGWLLLSLSPTISKTFMELAHFHFLRRFLKLLCRVGLLSLSPTISKNFMQGWLLLSLSPTISKNFMQGWLALAFSDDF